MPHTFRSRNLDFVRELCRVLGLDPDRHPVRSIGIHAGVADIPTVSVTMLLTADQDEALAEAIRVHRLEVKGAVDGR